MTESDKCATSSATENANLKLEPGWFIENGNVCYFFADFPTTYRIPINRYKIGQKMIDSHSEPSNEYLKNIRDSLDKISNEIMPITSEINKLQKKLHKLNQKVKDLNTSRVNIIRNVCKEYSHKWRRIINYDDAPSADGETLKCSRCGKVYTIRDSPVDDNNLHDSEDDSEDDNKDGDDNLSDNEDSSSVYYEPDDDYRI